MKTNVGLSEKAKPHLSVNKNPFKKSGEKFLKDLSESTKSLSENGVAVAKAITSPLAPSAKVDISDEARKKSDEQVAKDKESSKSKEQPKTLSKSEKSEILKKLKNGSLKRPGIFFVSGLDMWSGSSGGPYDGLRLMTEAVDGARLYSWNQKSDIIEQIKMTSKDYPIVLVGHSFGGDTAVDIANELNKIENGFRKVDLLITLDSVGRDNDVIPQNVGRNLNIISDHENFLSDGPNIAKNSARTTVDNIMRTEGHTAIDDVSEVQADIIEAIQDLLLKNKLDRL